jgi:PRTRC genetic system protein E
MTTNFFQNIAELNITGHLNITIKPGEDSKLAVSVLVTNPKASENSAKAIPPLLLKGNAQDLDEGFFDAIIQPLQQTDTLLVNIAEYQKGQEKAKTSLKSNEKKTKDDASKDDIEVTPQPSKEEKRKEYTEAVRKVVELTGQCKFEEALAILPSVTDFPDKSAEILKRKADLERMQAQKQLLLTD